MLLATLLLSALFTQTSQTPPVTPCTDPFLSYHWDGYNRAGDRTHIKCFVCRHSVTWQSVVQGGVAAEVTEPVADMNYVISLVNETPLGRLQESNDPGEDRPGAFYWAHPSQGPKLLLQGQQGSTTWIDDGSNTATLVDWVSGICSSAGPLAY